MSEARTLDELEAIVEANITAATLTAAALARIKAERLWQHSYRTWEVYCSNRWGFTARWANQLISEQTKPKVSSAGSQVVSEEPPDPQVEEDDYDAAMADDGEESDSGDDLDDEWDMGDPVGQSHTAASPKAATTMEQEDRDADPDRARKSVAVLARFFQARGESDRFGPPLQAMSDFIRTCH